MSWLEKDVVEGEAFLDYLRNHAGYPMLTGQVGLLFGITYILDWI